MPIQNRDDAIEVEGLIAAIFAAASGGRTNAIRRLFVETLDFDPASGQVSLVGAPASAVLPDAADRVAVLGGFHVLYIPLNIEGIDRVRKAEVDAAARLIADQLGDDLLLVFTNTSTSQLHLILPKFEGSRPTLRRMVVERDLPRRTAVQQVASIFWNHQYEGQYQHSSEERHSTSSQSPRTSSLSTSAYSKARWWPLQVSARAMKRASEPSCRLCSIG